MNEHIRDLNRLGQSVWIDNLHREMLESGRLAGWIEDGVSGVTSNPTILDKALRRHPSYRRDIAELASRRAAPSEIYDRLVGADIRQAADLLRSTWEQKDHREGLVSLEVSPKLAGETEPTIAEAERLWSLVARPNAMIKVPATPAGLPAITRLIARGIPINVTLIFSVEQYVGVADAYLRGLEERVARGLSPDVLSVASLFVSRIDTAVDALLPAGSPLRGHIAVSNAKLAYARWSEMREQPRWRQLAARGARPQRLLWGSTGTKNPAYSDLLYVEELAGPDTINTMPDATLAALLDHGRVRPSLPEGLDEARSRLDQLAALGIDLGEVCRQLQREGVRAFADSLDAMMRWIADEECALYAPPPA